MEAHTEEILLAQTQDLALRVVIVGVQDLADRLGAGSLADGALVIAVIEALHINAGALGLPQAQLGNTVGAVTGNIHIVGHGETVCNDIRAAWWNLLHVSTAARQIGSPPCSSSGWLLIQTSPPGSQLSAVRLRAVHQLLLKDAVLVQDGVAGAVVTIGGHAIQIAGGQTAQTAVA